jgi:hypothetical protein
MYNENIIYFCAKQANLMRSLIVLSLPPQFVVPAHTHTHTHTDLKKLATDKRSSLFGYCVCKKTKMFHYLGTSGLNVVIQSAVMLTVVAPFYALA